MAHQLARLTTPHGQAVARVEDVSLGRQESRISVARRRYERE